MPIMLRNLAGNLKITWSFEGYKGIKLWGAMKLLNYVVQSIKRLKIDFVGLSESYIIITLSDRVCNRFLS